MLDKHIKSASDEIRKNILTETYNAGTPIILEGDKNEYVYFLVEGSVDIVRYDEDGNEQRIYIHKQDSMFGEIELFDDINIQFNCITTEKSVVRKINKKLFVKWMREDEDFFRYVYNQLVMKLLYSSTRQLLDSKKTIKEKILEVLINKDNSNELHKLTKKELCVLIDAPIRSVNRVIAAMDGVEFLDGKFVLKK